MADDGWVDLAEAIRVLREQLVTAMAEGDGEQIRFELGPVELEVGLEMRQERAGEGGVRFGVLSLGGRGSESGGVSHRLKVILTPKANNGEAPLLSSAPREIPPR